MTEPTVTTDKYGRMVLDPFVWEQLESLPFTHSGRRRMPDGPPVPPQFQPGDVVTGVSLPGRLATLAFPQEDGHTTIPIPHTKIPILLALVYRPVAAVWTMLYETTTILVLAQYITHRMITGEVSEK